MEKEQVKLLSPSFIITCLLGFISMLSAGMINPILPIHAKMLNAPYWLVGMTVSSFFMGRTICEIPAGVLYHKIEWRLLMLIGLTIQMASMAAIYIMDNVYALIVARGIQGVGSTLFFLTAMSFVSSMSPRESLGKFMGTFQGLEWIGQICGTLVGGIAADALGTKIVFLLSAIIQAVGSVAMFCFKQKGGEEGNPKVEMTKKEPESSWWVLLKLPAVYVAGISIFFIMFGWQGIVNTLLPVYINLRLNFSLIFLGALAMCMSIAQTVGMFAGGVLSDRLGHKKVLLTAMTVLAVSSPLFGQARTMEQLIILSAVFGVTIGIGLTVPVVVIGSQLPPTQAGSAIAVYRTLMDIGGVVGPSMLATSTQIYGYSAGFMIAGLVMIAPIALLARASSLVN